ncbi:MAG: endopeptidase La [Planctomycetaceae bacterium]|nr:endopeptidase La [Planctomycetaceae bacterium]
MAREKNKTPIVGDDDSGVAVIPAARRPGAPGEGEETAVSIPSEAPVLAVRNLVLFPGTVVPLSIGRDKSRHLIESVLPDQKIIITVCQRDANTEDPSPEELYQFGTAVMVLKLLRLEENTQSIIVQGLSRVRIEQWMQTQPFFKARIAVMNDQAEQSNEIEALMINARDLARRIIELSPNIPDEAAVVLNNIDTAGALSDFLATNLQLDVAVKQEMLEELSVGRRLRRIVNELQHYIEVLQLSQKIQDDVKAKITKSQREMYLQEQLKAIQNELGQGDDRTVELEDLHKKIDASGMPELVLKEAVRELERMEKIPSASPEYHVIRTYLDWMIELPWSVSSTDKLEIGTSRRILDEDHYGLEKIKRRILEFLAVRKLAPESHGPILCFVGPPGVGKTSLGQSIARAMGRKFIRMSLGGMHDEAELRGHRRTYIGAMPGRVVQEIRKAGTNNPVFMLDELDKVGADFRGDPTSALLEVLDPAQNNSFQDHYLNVPFDLSKTLFIGTANYMAPVPPALRDRMEVIELPGYTRSEKLEIARRYLVRRQLADNGLKTAQVNWPDKALLEIIDSYTREAGVRELERQIGAVCRAVAALVAEGKEHQRTIDSKLIAETLGPPRYENELAQRTSVPGVATGLAYTPTGGEIIFIEAAGYPGKGNLTLTGQIGDVMKESAQAAMSLIKSRAADLHLLPTSLSDTDIHVHVPAGAVPKDGPSAGVAMFTALASLLMAKPVRHDVAMTGEITLRGLVLPIGGVKEKVLAAKRAGINTIILPERNRKDLVDVPPDAQKDLKFIFAKTVDDVLRAAMDGAARPHKHAGKHRKK